MLSGTEDSPRNVARDLYFNFTEQEIIVLAEIGS